MPLNFPENPVLNQYYVFNGIRWRWNGYAWTSAGVCGGNTVVGGICGEYVKALTGGVGITLTGPAGVVEISLKLDEPNIGPSNTEKLHTAPTTFNADTGYARKTAFLQPDGSITFDYIKNYDVFRTAEFNFDILSFDIKNQSNIQLNPQLIGNQITNNLNLSLYTAYYTFNEYPIDIQIELLNSLLEQGFPITADTLYSQYLFTNQYMRYPASLNYTNGPVNNDYQTFKLGVTGENSDGTVSYKFKNYNVYFYNYIFVGQSQSTTINDFSSLTAYLNGSRSWTINMSVNQTTPPTYVYYAYPARLGSAIFRDNSTNIEGGFIQQTINGVSTLPYTNPRGYTENYVVYRSENGNLGNISITVS